LFRRLWQFSRDAIVDVSINVANVVVFKLADGSYFSLRLRRRRPELLWLVAVIRDAIGLAPLRSGRRPIPTGSRVQFCKDDVGTTITLKGDPARVAADLTHGVIALLVTMGFFVWFSTLPHVALGPLIAVFVFIAAILGGGM